MERNWAFPAYGSFLQLMASLLQETEVTPSCLNQCYLGPSYVMSPLACEVSIFPSTHFVLYCLEQILVLCFLILPLGETLRLNHNRHLDVLAGAGGVFAGQR